MWLDTTRFIPLDSLVTLALKANYANIEQRSIYFTMSYAGI